MTNYERDELLEEIRLLKVLLNFHVQNRGNILMNELEFEEYVNAILDRLNDLTILLEGKQ